MIEAIIPVYNGEKFILKAIQSIVNQTLVPSKIIVVDDGSTDRTSELVTNYAKTVKIPIEIKKQRNSGLSAARNSGIKSSHAEFIAFLDADDEWHANKLEEQMRIFNQSDLKNIGLVYCSYETIDETNNKLEEKAAEIDPAARGFIFDRILEANTITSSASGALIKKECFEKVGYFDENLNACEDWDMWLRIAEKYNFDYSNNILVKIRRHSQNMQKDKCMMLKNHISFYNKWTKLLQEKKVPKKWRIDVLSSILQNRPNFRQALYLIKNNMSRQSSKALFGNKLSVATHFFFFVLKKVILKLTKWKTI